MKILLSVQAFKQLPQTSLGRIMQLLGLMTAAVPGVPWAQLHSRPLQAFLLLHWDCRKYSLDQLVKIPEGNFLDLAWWEQREHLQRGKDWTQHSPVKITTDASLWGWAAHSQDWQAQGAWLPEEAGRSGWL